MGATRSYMKCALILALIVMGGATVWATAAKSASYTMAIDAVSCAGGSATSTSYRLVDSGVGQDSVAGAASSSSYRENSGVVQSWPVSKNAVEHWLDY